MRVLHDNVLVTEHKQENTTESGLIISGSKTTGHKPAIVIAVGPQVEGGIVPQSKVYLDWSKALPIELDGVKCGVVKYEDIKLVVDE